MNTDESLQRYGLTPDDQSLKANIRGQVQRLIGQSLEIPEAVRKGAHLYIPKP